MTLRDPAGRVVTEYEEIDAVGGPKLSRHYVHAGSRLVATHIACGPPPSLSLGPPQPDTVVLHKIDHVAPTGAYTIVIESDTGEMAEILEPATLPDEFAVDVGALFDGHNRIRLQAQAECGRTGYSNAVSWNSGGGPGACLTATGLSHADFALPVGGGGAESTVSVMGLADGSCPSGVRYNAYYLPEGGGSPVALVQLLTSPQLELPHTPLGAGHGTYWFRAYDPATKAEGADGPIVSNTADNTSGGSGQSPAHGTPSMSTEYVHADHLGSTRLVTDEMGLELASFKYYPFGHEAETSSGTDLRMKFTGHERDRELGLDYMLARYYGASLGQFLSVDPVDGNPNDPQRWNRYSYVTNNPTNAIDPDGRESAMVLMNKEEQLMAEGKLSRQEFEARWFWRGVAAGAGTAIAGASVGPAAIPYVKTGLLFYGPKSIHAASTFLAGFAGMDAGRIGPSGMKLEYQQQVLRIGNTIKNSVTPATIKGALRELAGKETIRHGRSWDHVNKVTEALQGLTNRVENLKRGLADPKLSDDARDFIKGVVAKTEEVVRRVNDTLKDGSGQ